MASLCNVDLSFIKPLAEFGISDFILYRILASEILKDSLIQTNLHALPS